MRALRGKTGTIVATLVLLASLAGWGWFATEQAREGWWTLGEHVAVAPDAQGWATVDTLRVRLDGAEPVAVVEEEEAPAGFTYLALDFRVEAPTQGPLKLSTCEVQARDEQGRLFLAGEEVPRADPYESSLMCGTSDPDEDPVPGRQSVLVLVPDDAQLVSVRVDAREFPAARFIELPLSS